MGICGRQAQRIRELKICGSARDLRRQGTLTPQLGEPLSKDRAIFRVSQSELHRRFKVPNLRATIEALTEISVSLHSLVARENIDCVRQLYLSSATRW